MSAQLGLVRPEALALLAVVGALGLLALVVERRRRGLLVAFAGKGGGLASVSGRRRTVKAALAVSALALVAAAAAGPYVDVVRRGVIQRGVDVVVALDVSQSMAVRDVEPDRLRAAKEVVARLGDEIRQSRVALVLFAGEGILRYPASSDPTVLGRTLDTVSIAFRPPGGSSLGAAVQAALDGFPKDALESARRKAVVLVTDGEDTSAERPDVAALRDRNVSVYAVGVGTASGGPVPTYDRSGRFSGYLKRANGSEIISRLTEAPLRSLAEETGGKYWRLAGAATASEIAKELRRLDATELAPADARSVPDDRYQLFLLVAVLLLIADSLISDRRPMPLPSPGLATRAPGLRPRLARLFIAGAVLGSCAGTGPTDADRLYLEGRNSEALARYRELIAARPGVAELHVNAGNALYGLTRYDEALAEYEFAIRSGDERVRAVAQYQRGDALFRLGRADDARAAFVAALKLDPNDRDAKINIELIDRLRARSREQSDAQRNKPGASGPPGKGEQSGQGQGSPAGEGSGEGQGQGQADAPTGAPGTEGPQASGPPTSIDRPTGPSLAQALRDFRSNISEDQALRLLDALLQAQPGIEALLQGQGGGPQGQDPAY